jgi:regulator of nucleoside diphosphate kinase
MSTRSDFAIALDDERRLQTIVRTAMAEGDGRRAALLGDKLHRAIVLPVERLGADRVRMLASGRYRDEATGAVHGFTLVYPGYQRNAAGLVSVLSEAGTALLGLRTGQRVSWFGCGGRVRTIRLLEVAAPLPPERLGEAARAP